MFDRITMLDYQRPLSARAKARKSCGPYTWTPTAPGQGRGFYGAGSDSDLRCDPRGSTFQLRLEVVNGATRRVWASDTDFIPVIARLPRGRGFLAGWSMGAGMCGSLEPDVHETERDAQRAARVLACEAADREAEYLATEQEDDE